MAFAMKRKSIVQAMLLGSALLLLSSCWRDITGWFSSTADTTSTTGAASTSATPASPTAPAATLPFGVTIGGQAARIKPPLDQFGTLSGPVAADAVISVNARVDSVIINAFPCDVSGNVDSGAQPAIMVMQKTTSAKLSDTLDQKALAPGKYMLNVVAGQLGTARLVIDVQ
jgi:hypothetical protein